MSYEKDKQAWYDKERRHKLVLAIINDKPENQDRELLPAYNRFIETGDEEMFKLFNDFLKLMDTRQRANEMEKETKRLQECTDEFDKMKKRYEEVKALYESYYNDMMKERAELCTKIDAMPDEEVTNYVGHIRDFISKSIDGKRGWASKPLRINVNGELRFVKSITLTDNNQFVLDVAITKPMTPPAPEKPEKNTINGRNRKLIVIDGTLRGF